MTTYRCAILDDYQHVALAMADWSNLVDRIEIRAHHDRFADEDDLVDAIGDCEIVVIMRERTPFPAHLLARLPRLKLLVTTGMRNASIDLAAAHARGVTVCGTDSLSTPPVELTWALILALARNVISESGAVRSGGWQLTVGDDLHGRCLGLLGLGKIGAKVAAVGLAFGMDVVAWSQHLTDERAAAVGVRRVASKDALLEASDYVSIHLVLSGRTRGLLGADDLKRMRPTAYLINTSRAAIVHQEAMVKALREGWIAGAAVDVFEQEPLRRDHELRRVPNLLATPHLGYVSRGNYQVYFRHAIEDIIAFLDGTPVRVLRDPNAG